MCYNLVYLNACFAVKKANRGLLCSAFTAGDAPEERDKPESYRQPLSLVLNCYVMMARSSYFLLTTHLIKCFTKRLNKACWTWGSFQSQLCSTCSLSATPPLFWTGCRDNGGVFNLHTVVFIFTRWKPSTFSQSPEMLNFSPLAALYHV